MLVHHVLLHDHLPRKLWFPQSLQNQSPGFQTCTNGRRSSHPQHHMDLGPDALFNELHPGHCHTPSGNVMSAAGEGLRLRSQGRRDSGTPSESGTSAAGDGNQMPMRRTSRGEGLRLRSQGRRDSGTPSESGMSATGGNGLRMRLRLRPRGRRDSGTSCDCCEPVACKFA